MNADNLGGFYNGAGTPPDASNYLEGPLMSLNYVY
jgi:hypothetical protein